MACILTELLQVVVLKKLYLYDINNYERSGVLSINAKNYDVLS